MSEALLQNEIGYFADIPAADYEAMIAAYCTAARVSCDFRPIEKLVEFSREFVDEMAVDVANRLSGAFHHVYLYLDYESMGKIEREELRPSFRSETLDPSELARAFTGYFRDVVRCKEPRRDVPVRIDDIPPLSAVSQQFYQSHLNCE